MYGAAPHAQLVWPHLMRPGDERLDVRPDPLTQRLIGQSPFGVEMLPGARDHQLRLEHRITLGKWEYLPPGAIHFRKYSAASQAVKRQWARSGRQRIRRHPQATAFDRVGLSG